MSLEKRNTGLYCLQQAGALRSINNSVILIRRRPYINFLGGMGNSMAAVVAGLFLGLLEAFVVSVLPSSYKEVAAIVVLLLILVFRPRGLFARRDASALRTV